MQKIFIKYNPYKVETEILIDGNVPKKNSRLSHGIAVLCKECEVEVGPQDIVWMEE